MTIKKQYILPNCTLTLEGLSEASEETNDVFAQQPLSILVNAECHFVGSNQKLSGGSVFFENLVKSVSAYAQEFLSGLPHRQNSQTESSQIHIEKITAHNLHRLTFEPESDTQQQKSEIELNTVELFDLVEAVDQFFADKYTLSSIRMELQSLGKRYRQRDEPLIQRLTPVGIGLASLAFATTTFFVIPIPEISEPQSTPQSSPTEVEPTPLEDQETEVDP
ncbi:MAG: DUF4335 domain-containing protein [Xenococcaceae cyanobacterium]